MEVGRRAALKEWNTKLEERVDAQVAELGWSASVKVVFSALTQGHCVDFAPHRREICYVFVDLRGFTAFTDAAKRCCGAPDADDGRAYQPLRGTLDCLSYFFFKRLRSPFPDAPPTAL